MRRENLQGFFKKDLATLCLLALLNGEDEPQYGYDLMLKMEQYSEGRFVLPEGTLYPILYRMEELGYVVGEKKLVGKRMQRVYYRLTDPGRDFYRQMSEAYASVSRGANDILTRTQRKERKHEEQTD